ncbi:MAG TPA: TonB-dependent receptor [Thermoanaerobaculia bacterium]|nr:TonB-dependent receptor [Thermoanaerobaculia bacterium]
MIFLSASALAQNGGAVSGMVLDARTGQPVRSAMLAVEGSETTAATDLNGIFQARLPAGTWDLVVTAEGYEPQKLTGVVVEQGGTANVSLVLDRTAETPASQRLSTVTEEITVQAEAIAATEQALLAERKAAAQIVDNIGSEEISKNSGSDAAGALKRVTGISLQEDKFVYVRGLGGRYSNTQLNGSKIPSTEFERKIVPLDLFPAELLEKITVSKSYTVDQPGDFVAGVVELETRDFPPNQKLSVGISGGFNSETTGEPLLAYPGGLDLSGGGGQALPSGIPDQKLLLQSPFTGEGFTAGELEGFGELLVGDWTPRRRSSGPLDQGYKLSYGNSFDRVGLLLSATAENDFEARQEERAFYGLASGGGLTRQSDFDFDYGEERVRRSLMGNLAFRVGDNSQLQLRALDTSLANTEGRVQEGDASDFAQDIRDLRLQFRDQDVQSFQLSGDHFLQSFGGSGGSVLQWRTASSGATTEENLREVIYEERFGEFVLSNQGQTGFFYFNDLEDELLDGRLDWQMFFKGSGESFGSLKLGFARLDSERQFDGRRLRFFPRRTTGIDLTAPPEEIYSVENVDPDFFEIREVTNPTDSYTGDHTVDGAYVQGDWSWSDWRVIGGVRWEDSTIDVLSFERTTPDQATVITVAEDSVLPSLSVVYALGPRTNLRASYSRTVNRPEFRELAPFEFKGIVGGVLVKGNPDLVQAEIDSFDLRWEYFPSGGEVLAASVFYKQFDNPIESVLIASANIIETQLNADQAENFGFEVEARKRLGSLFSGASWLDSFTAIANYAWVDSEIEIPADETILTNPNRPLTGQPDNLLNFVLEWAPTELGNGIAVRLLYNRIDDKVLLGGALGVPDVFEESRETVDLVWSQPLFRGLGVKVSAMNLLEEEKVWTQGGEIWRRYQPGRSFGLSFGYAF